MKQHTALWRATKAHYLGANDCASILGHGFYTIDQVIKSKVTRTEPAVTPEQQQRMDYGTKYEGLVRQECANRHGIVIQETGLKFHKQFKFLTASPDGICVINSIPTLTEFKVLGELSDGKIPLKYWIQMQIQMAVWGIARCLYCENIVKNEQVTEYYEHYVDFDQEWFNEAMVSISKAWDIIEQQRSASRRVKRKFKDETEDLKPIYPQDLVNYIRNDPLLDWLNAYGPEEQKDKNRPKFFSMIKRLNNQFSYLIKQDLKKRFVNIDIDPVVTVNNNGYLRSLIPVTSFNVEQTRNAISGRTPLIFNATFSLNQNQQQGVADILVLNRYLNTVFNLDVKNDDPPDMYSIVQIHYATLDLRVNSNLLTNTAKQRVYKVKLWFLNNLLTEVQGRCSTYSYILGRSYQSKGSNGTKITNAFGNVAVILNNEHQEEHQAAFEWRLSLKRDIPLVNMEFNMKNMNDFPWHSYKVSLGKVTKDITNMYRCGPKIKEKAKEANVDTWDNSGLRDVQGVNRSVHSFMEANMAESKPIPRKLALKLPRYRFYLDFETCGSVYDDFSTFPEAAKDTNCIFLIGVIAEDGHTGALEYFSFVADDLSRKAELTILEQMFNELKRWQAEDEEITLLHWGNAEKQLLDQSWIKTNAPAPVPFKLLDLCNVMRKNSVIFPGQFGYGLKEMGTVMKGLNLIETGWPKEDEDISNGMDAMVEAIKVYKYKDRKDEVFFEKVKKYNYIDCKVMQEIVGYLDTSHN